MESSQNTSKIVKFNQIFYLSWPFFENFDLHFAFLIIGYGTRRCATLHIRLIHRICLFFHQSCWWSQLLCGRHFVDNTFFSSCFPTFHGFFFNPFLRHLLRRKNWILWNTLLQPAVASEIRFHNPLSRSTFCGVRCVHSTSNACLTNVLLQLNLWFLVTIMSWVKSVHSSRGLVLRLMILGSFWSFGFITNGTFKLDGFL